MMKFQQIELSAIKTGCQVTELTIDTNELWKTAIIEKLKKLYFF